MKINMIMAVAENSVIGKGGDLPWHLARDLQHFKTATIGHAIIMGRKTCASIAARTGGKPLPKRLHIIMSRNPHFAPAMDGVMVATTVAEAIECAKRQGHKEIFVIGGGEIYRLFEPFAQRILLTRVHAKPAGDTYFTLSQPQNWQQTACQKHKADANNSADFSFIVLDSIAQDAPPTF